MKNKLFKLLFYTVIMYGFLGVSNIWAQETVTGVITSSEDNKPLPGTSIYVENTQRGTISGADGSYSIEASRGERLVYSFVGFKTKIVPIIDRFVINVRLEPESYNLDEFVVIGTRNLNRSALNTAVPVDVITLDAIQRDAPQIEVTQVIQYAAPSFSSNRQTISDGTDHVDPASLRGLGVDHVLVLVNGKRRHTSSLINVNGTFGRGSVGTDLNSIPVAAIKRVEILRDGAASQYGSDAIAGVINIILEDEVDKVLVTSGIGQTNESDGKTSYYNVNYGLKLDDRGGFINFTGQYQYRGRTNRSGAYTGDLFRTNGSGIFAEDFEAGDYSPYNLGVKLTATEAVNLNAMNAQTNNMTDAEQDALIEKYGGRKNLSLIAGESQVTNGAFYYNGEVVLPNGGEVYFFGGYNYRYGLASGFYRRPNQSRNVLTIYEAGFLPEIHSQIHDFSTGIGIKGKVKDWNVDLSTVVGLNSFNFFIDNTLNASLGSASPTSFDAGGFSFIQNTSNIDISRFYDDILNGMNVAFGAEFRLENYSIYAGEEASYTDYGRVNVIDSSSNVVPNNTTNIMYGRPGGSQVFPGFRPSNELSRYRSNAALYFDLELNMNENWYVSGAGRFESYSDFGETFNVKVSTRVEPVEDIALRAAFSTGFRAPSLHQRYFNNTSTIFTLDPVTNQQVPNEVGTFRNDSRLASLLGIPSLKNESSLNISFGGIWKLDERTSITIDAYQIDVDDKIILTDQFNPESSDDIANILASVNAGRAQFFTNAIDTRTRGVEFILSTRQPIGPHILKSTIFANFNDTEVRNVKIPATLNADPTAYFNRTQRSFIETATPKSKVGMLLQYEGDNLFVTLNNIYFGDVTARQGSDSDPVDQTFKGKLITDLSIGYRFNPNILFTVGGNNIFNVYPDENRAEYQSSGQFIYSRRTVQFGTRGRYYFGRFQISL